MNFKDKKWQGHLVERGQLITSNNHLATELKLSVQVIRTALQKLHEGGYIKIKATNRFTLITLINYDKFQSSKAENNKPVINQVTIKKHTSNNQITTTKESNKENKTNKKTIDDRRERFKKQVFKHSQYEIKVLESFYDYWSELNSDKSEMRYETERFFEIKKRLKKWLANERTNKIENKSKTELLTNR
ncbi:hypothetical protein [Psychroserpens mesophilus]|uniref:hypothetical protein n=1 Tax=Psychroserpens mesophilus TaxID=325473 RepID=UPI001269FFF4|nr:hypothetical protein [Psychroserpens mesophilus]